MDGEGGRKKFIFGTRDNARLATYTEPPPPLYFMRYMARAKKPMLSLGCGLDGFLWSLSQCNKKAQVEWNEIQNGCLPWINEGNFRELQKVYVS